MTPGQSGPGAGVNTIVLSLLSQVICWVIAKFLVVFFIIIFDLETGSYSKLESSRLSKRFGLSGDPETRVAYPVWDLTGFNFAPIPMLRGHQSHPSSREDGRMGRRRRAFTLPCTLLSDSRPLTRIAIPFDL